MYLSSICFANKTIPHILNSHCAYKAITHINSACNTNIYRQNTRTSPSNTPLAATQYKEQTYSRYARHRLLKNKEGGPRSSAILFKTCINFPSVLCIWFVIRSTLFWVAMFNYLRFRNYVLSCDSSLRFYLCL